MSHKIDWERILAGWPGYENLLSLFLHLRDMYWDCETIAPMLGVSSTSLYLKMRKEGVPFNRTKKCPHCGCLHAAPCETEQTLNNVCFSCQHFKWSNVSLKKPSSGTCTKHGPRFPEYDGLTRKKCGDYIGKHQVYPKQLRVIRILPKVGV
jgi:hypothetical protein